MTTPCVFVRPGRAIARPRPAQGPQSRTTDPLTLWTLDREATARGITVEHEIYKLSLPPEAVASDNDPPAPTGLPERYTLVFFEPGKMAVYRLDSER